MALLQRGKLIAVIGDEDTVVGFLLGGVGMYYQWYFFYKSIYVQGQLNKSRKSNFLIVDKNTGIHELEEKFREFCTRDDIAIILINQHVAEMIRYQVDQHVASIPTVLEIPSKEMPYDASKVINKQIISNSQVCNLIFFIGQHIEPCSWPYKPRGHEIRIKS
jgi:V-type H+-transporting ATPase subunit F